MRRRGTHIAVFVSCRIQACTRMRACTHTDAHICREGGVVFEEGSGVVLGMGVTTPRKLDGPTSEPQEDGVKERNGAALVRT